MVLSELRAVIPRIPDPRPGKANAEERAKRKQYEKEHPHFAMQEFGMKAGVLAAVGALTLYPWEKKREEHVREHHPERLERRRDRERDTRDDGRRDMRSDERRERRSMAGDRERREEERRYPAPVVEEQRERRVGLPEKGMKLAVAEGFEYIVPDKAYLNDRYQRGVDTDRRPRRGSDYVYGDRRDGRKY